MRRSYYKKISLTRRPLDLRMASDRFLGEILVESGKVSQPDIARALETQRVTGMRIGQTLVDMGLSNWEEIEQALRTQHALRPGSEAPTLETD
jgi:hypothetical protein